MTTAVWAVAAWALAPGALAQQNLGALLPAAVSIHFVAFGDFGRRGKPWEAQVAEAIARRNASDPVQLGLTLGDNFYECGVKSVHDAAFHDLWEVFYGPLKIPFYATLGNHDYARGEGACAFGSGDPQAEVEYTRLSRTWRMPARYYMFTAGPVQFFALDTVAWDRRERAWIERQLSEPPPAGVVWRVVYGHHPVYTSGRHHIDPRVKQLQRELLPLLVAHHVDLYAAGHDHDLEHLRVEGVDLFIAGGGGDEVRGVERRERHSLAAASAHGFLDVEADRLRLRGTLFDTDLHSLENPPWEKTR